MCGWKKDVSMNVLLNEWMDVILTVSGDSFKGPWLAWESEFLIDRRQVERGGVTEAVVNAGDKCEPAKHHTPSPHNSTTHC